ncbi:hypothetical protein AAMO2058_000127000 [Amorphochlora amoebiformis]
MIISFVLADCHFEECGTSELISHHLPIPKLAKDKRSGKSFPPSKSQEKRGSGIENHPKRDSGIEGNKEATVWGTEGGGEEEEEEKGKEEKGREEKEKEEKRKEEKGKEEKGKEEKGKEKKRKEEKRKEEKGKEEKGKQKEEEAEEKGRKEKGKEEKRKEEKGKEKGKEEKRKEEKRKEEKGKQKEEEAEEKGKKEKGKEEKRKEEKGKEEKRKEEKGKEKKRKEEKRKEEKGKEEKGKQKEEEAEEKGKKEKGKEEKGKEGKGKEEKRKEEKGKQKEEDEKGRGRLRMGKWFGDGMVLQSRTRDGKGAALYGLEALGSLVTVTVESYNLRSQPTSKYRIYPNENGEWRLMLKPRAPSRDIYRITIKGTRTLTAQNVRFGDVYMFSGQSNMELPLGITIGYRGLKGEIKRLMDHTPNTTHSHHANFSTTSNTPTESLLGAQGKIPWFKLFYVARGVSNKAEFDIPEASDTCPGTCNKWLTIDQIGLDKFSGVGYFSAINLAKFDAGGSMDWPIGVILSTWGSSEINSWVDTHKCPDSDNSMQSRSLAAMGNAMVAPLTQLSKRGFIWYQGESDGYKHHTTRYYECGLRRLISRERSGLCNGRMAFIIIQLAPSSPSLANYSGKFVRESGTPPIRLAQLNVGVGGILSSEQASGALANLPPNSKNNHDKSTPNGLVVTLDLGGVSRWGIKHSPRKFLIGERVALALSRTAFAPNQLTNHNGQAFNTTWNSPIALTATLHKQTTMSLKHLPWSHTFNHSGSKYMIFISFDSSSSRGLYLKDNAHCRLCCQNSTQFQIGVQLRLSRDARGFRATGAEAERGGEISRTTRASRARVREKGVGKRDIDIDIKPNPTHHNPNEIRWFSIQRRDVRVVEFGVLLMVNHIKLELHKHQNQHLNRSSILVRYGNFDYVECLVMNDASLPASPFQLPVDLSHL